VGAKCEVQLVPEEASLGSFAFPALASCSKFVFPALDRLAGWARAPHISSLYEKKPEVSIVTLIETRFSDSSTLREYTIAF
jgi:hypothetical protein